MVLSLTFRCTKPCQKSFSSQRGLTKHQDSCAIYGDVTGAELLASVEMEQSARKRPRLASDPLADHITKNMTVGADVDGGWNIDDCVPEAVELVRDNELPMVEGPVLDELGRGKRRKWRTRRYVDPRPEPPAPLPEPDCPSVSAALPASNLPKVCKTAKNANDVYREYVSRPTFIPEEWSIDLDFPLDAQHPDDYVPDNNASGSAVDARSDDPQALEALQLPHTLALNQPLTSWFAPFLNVTTFRLMNWFWGSSAKKSIADLQSLADNVLKADDFKPGDLEKFNVKMENKRLDEWASSIEDSPSQSARDGWIHSDVEILLPTRIRYSLPSDIARFKVSGLYHRSIVEVIKASFQSKLALRFHYTPFKQFWHRSEEETPNRVYDELYTGDVWLQQHEDLQKLPRDADDEYERAIAGLMFWSDSTHLTNFGNASLWPLYMYYGNQSKYERAQPSSNACHHIAYFPKLPDNITDAFKKINGGKLPTSETLTHCKRELMHALLETIFDDTFKKACTDGLLIRCYDGVVRRIFPRILTYSADYPEKTLLASIKFLSVHPCPRCMIRKSDTHRLGSRNNENIVKHQLRIDSHPQQVDIQYARNFIYKEGRGVKSAAVEAVLSSKLLVPTTNAFSKALFLLGYNFYAIFVVDFLHEVELGIWKMIFIHLIRILAVCAQESIMLLNERYRLISSFGSDTIRKFTNDASSLKKMAARDYEDLLLCSLPVFEGLFPEPHDSIVQRLLFALQTWHALGKLRTHTETTLQLLDGAKRQLSLSLQDFQGITCQAYETKELPSERLRREKRDARKEAFKATNPGPETSGSASQNPSEEVQQENRPQAAQRKKSKGKRKDPKEKEVKGKDAKGKDEGSKRKRLNLNTYKVHALDHYVQDIRNFGTLDSYSTQIGELQHRAVKMYYSRTNKLLPVQQITKIERREHVLREISSKDPAIKKVSTFSLPTAARVVAKNCEEHHQISNSRNHSIYLNSWLREHIYDPATKSFLRKLKDHLLERLLKTSWDGDLNADFTDSDRNTVHIEYNRLYEHKILRVNYTTYDSQRRQDSMNPRTHPDIMVFSTQDDLGRIEESHPYCYARIIGVFHTMIRHSGRRSTTEGVPVKMEILWVRWFRLTTIPEKQLSSRRLHALAFVPQSDAGAFGFIDPKNVIRGAHLIPAFQFGKTSDLLCHSIGRQSTEEDEDWKYYYVNCFVDRDMYMRYTGGGIGHTMLCLRNSALDGPNLDIEPVIFNDNVHCHTSHLNDETQHRVIIDTYNDEVRSIDEDRDNDSSDTESSEEE